MSRSEPYGSQATTEPRSHGQRRAPPHPWPLTRIFCGLMPCISAADDASRRWDLNDSDLLTHFNYTYPQAVSWHMLTLQSDTTTTALTGALSRRRPVNASPSKNVPPAPLPHGRSGRPSVPVSASHPSACPMLTPYLFSNCLPSATATGPLPPVVDLSGLGQWRTPYKRWVRRIPSWGPRTLA